MDIFVCTVFYDGQFWIALIETSSSEGSKRVGKYTFGAEPSNNDLKDFYLFRLSTVPLREGTLDGRIKTNRKPQEETRMLKKSLSQFKALQTEYLESKKRETRKQERLDENARFEQRQEKKKRKRKGH